MNNFLLFALVILPLSPVSADAADFSAAPSAISRLAPQPITVAELSFAQQNIIGEVAAIDESNRKITILTETKTNLVIAFDDKTVVRRVAAGQTSIDNAAQIKSSDIKIGDRILIFAGAADQRNPARRIIVMTKSAVAAPTEDEILKRRARTISGRIAALDANKKEIFVQPRGSAETLAVAITEGVKLRRYAPDSLKLSDAFSGGSFADFRVGDQVRVVGDRSDGKRVAAEEIVSGSVTRSVGTITEINAARGEIVVKNAQTGETAIVLIGKKTAVRRITPEMANALKQRFEKSAARPKTSASGAANQANQSPENRNSRLQLESLPLISLADLKKGDAVLIVATSGNARSSFITAVSVISGDSELQRILQQTQSDSNADLGTSTGLPGNVSGGNAVIDEEEPRN